MSKGKLRGRHFPGTGGGGLFIFPNFWATVAVRVGGKTAVLTSKNAHTLADYIHKCAYHVEAENG